MICPNCGCEFDEEESPGRCAECGFAVPARKSSPDDESGYTREEEERFMEEEDNFPW